MRRVEHYSSFVCAASEASIHRALAAHSIMAKVPLSSFLSAGDGPPTDLPEGPVEEEADTTHKKMWIADDLELAASGGRAVELTLDEFKAQVDLALREFLGGEAASAAHTARQIEALGARPHHAAIVKRAVALAMDKGGREREMAAGLLSSLHARGVLSSAQVSDGFRTLLETMDELLLDIPDAAGLVSHFLADSHLDGLLPMSMLDEIEKAVAGQPAAASVVKEARSRLRGRVPLGGSQGDSRSTRSDLRNVVGEYLISRDAAEVGRRCAELCVPADLQHELVRAAVELAIERKDSDRELVSQLLSALHDQWLPAADIALGFEALLARIDDLALDSPKAVTQLAAFMTRAVADEILPPACACALSRPFLALIVCTCARF